MTMKWLFENCIGNPLPCAALAGRPFGNLRRPNRTIFFAIEARCSAKPAFFVALALFALTFSVCAAFLSSMRNAPQELTRGR
jgi:hypothetical protein